jgi:NADH-quinone oxidoreductase subunit N
MTVTVPTHADLVAIAPEIILAVAAGVLLVIEAFIPRLRRYLSELTLLAVVGAGWARLSLELPGAVWGGMIRIDQVSAFVDIYILVAIFLTAWMAGPFLKRSEADYGEFYSLLLLAGVGAMVMASSVDLLPLFLGLELLSIPLYVLNAFFRRNSISVEAGLKYFVVGAFASAFVVYGIALLYGATASTNLLSIGPQVVTNGGLNPLVAVGVAMVVGAALVVLLRMADGMDLLTVSPRWLMVMAVIAVASQTLGNIVAIVQRDIKRMLAYSGIAHMGYALVAVIVAGTEGGAAVLVYLAAYTLMNMGAFAAVALLSEREDEPHLISNFAGQGWKRPAAALALAICLFSLAGIPPFIGFTAKFVVFRAAVNAGLVWLAILGVINSLISAFYYLRVVYVMYMQPLPKREPSFKPSLPISAAAAVAALGVVVLGLYPTAVLAAAQNAILSLVK